MEKIEQSYKALFQTFEEERKKLAEEKKKIDAERNGWVEAQKKLQQTQINMNRY